MPLDRVLDASPACWASDLRQLARYDFHDEQIAESLIDTDYYPRVLVQVGLWEAVCDAAIRSCCVTGRPE